MASPTQRDPRSIVTPDAFEISSALVGLPLARPRRRAAALLVDGVVIGVITLITHSFALILGVVAAALFIRAGFQRTKVRGSVFGRAMRLSVGCLGIFIAMITAVLWASFGIDFSRGARTGAEFGLESSRPAESMAPLAGVEPAPEADPSDDSGLPTQQPTADVEQRPVSPVDTDSLAYLEARISALQDEVDDRERDLRRTRAALEQTTRGGFLDGLRGLVDELGFGFGWAALYMTVFLSWWNGQTVGKRLLGIRVVRLDGGPITWWIAFERAGGYAAGLATGLLGFAQVWWDANRQAIHDRIVGTVVVVDGAERIVDWRSGL